MLRSLFLYIALVISPLCVNANCITPTLLTINQVSDSTAILTWTDVGDAYQLELRLASESFTGVPTHVVPSDPPFSLQNLLPGEQYKFRVRTVCTGGGESPWSAQRTFATELNNNRPCPLDFTIRDTTCASNSQLFKIHTNHAPGTALGTNISLKGLRLVLTHPWRSDLRIWLHSPDGTRIQVLGGLNAGDQNLGNPAGNGGCGQYLELTDDAAALPLGAAAEQDNITGFWRALNALSGFHNGQNPNGIWQLEICDNKLSHTGKLKLVQLVFEAADCPAPPAPTVSNIQINSIELGWNTFLVQGDSIEWAYGPKGFVPEYATQTLRLPTINAQPYVLSNLNALQYYDIFMRQRCATSGVWSAYSAPTPFFTVCPAVIVENFDTLAVCPTGCTDACPLPNIWQNAPGDDYEWKVRTGAGITYPTAGPASASGGTGNYLFFRNACSPSGANGKKAILRTLCLDISAPAGPPCHFSLDIYMNTKLGQMGSLALEGSIDGGQTWQPIQTWSGNRGKLWRREFVNLTAYDGKTALFQLVATGVFGAYGDIAVDNLTFYSASPAGTPDYTFYQDADNDGFGSNTNRVIVCSPNAPVGYIAASGDCNDNNAAIFPNAPEIKCNGTDENCNGNTDDTFIPTPIIGHAAAVCSGQNIVFQINGLALGQYYWFDAPLGGQLLGTGPSLTLMNVTDNVVVWAMDSLGSGCASVRQAASVSVLAQPQLVLGALPEICLGATLNLANLPINDLAQTTGILNFYSGFPTNMANQINNTTVQPNSNILYFARKTASNGCTDTLQIPVIVHVLPTVNIANGDSLAFCNGKTVVLQANGLGGTQPLQYAWSNGIFQNTAQVIASGNGFSTTTYTVTVTDQFGCTAKDAIKITALPGVSQTNVTNLQNVGFCGGNNGSISLQALDGLPPYAFQWTGPNQSAGIVSGVGTSGGTISGLTQGGYRITITDATGLGCSMVLPSLVLNAPGLTVGTPQVTQPVCPNGTGSIGVVVSGSAPAFLWNNNATTSTVTNLLPGTYTVTITDGACQQIISDIKITAPPTLQIAPNQIVATTCSGASDGKIDIEITGGTAPYQYLWTDMATAADRTNLAAGIFRVTVTDAHNCTAVSPVFVVSEPNSLEIAAQITPVSCNGANDGAISIDVMGGTGDYFVEWNTGAFVHQIASLVAGNYTVTLSDQNGCIQTQTIAVTEPNAVSITLVNSQNPTCAGKNNGALAVQVAGGTPGYTYLWNNNAVTAALSNLEDGAYQLRATDANGCTAISAYYTLVAPEVIDIQLNTVQNVACFSSNSGSIDVVVSGTNGGITTQMNGIATVFPQNNLLSGIYFIEATDNQGCTVDTTIVITQPKQPLTVSVAQINAVSCYSEPTGQVDIATSGGTAPYTYLWSNGATTEDLDAALANTYALLVTDARGCQAGMMDIVLPQPSPFVAMPTIEHIQCIGAPYGKIILSVGGGTMPYAYHWSNGATTANIVDAPAGDYAVSIFDATGCLTVYDSLQIVDKRLDFGVQFVAYQPVSCNAGNDGWLQAQVFNGTAPYQYAWSSPVGLHSNIATNTDIASLLSGGEYRLTVTDAAGCFRAAGPFLVEEAPPVLLQIPTPNPIVCKGTPDGSLVVNGLGGVPPLSYLWSNGDSAAQADSLLAGTYYVTITDVRGCSTVSVPIVLTEPSIALAIQTDEVLQDVCSDSTGAIYTTALGGYAQYQFQWNQSNNNSDLEHLPAGYYTLTLTDGKGCSVTQSWTLDVQPAALSLASYSVVPVACNGAATGAIETGILGGNQPLQYFWSNGATTANIGQLAAGAYRVTVQDAKGCLDIFDLPQVTEPDSPLVVAYASTSEPDNKYTVAIQCSGGVPVYTAQWDALAGNQMGLVAYGLAPAYYNVTVTDAAGCAKIVSVYAGTSGTETAFLDKNQVSLRPNPSSGHTVVHFAAPANESGKWSLVSAQGKTLMDGYWSQGDTHISIAGAHLEAGVYCIFLTSENAVKQAKALRWVVVR